jgi:hypothetical protein
MLFLCSSRSGRIEFKCGSGLFMHANTSIGSNPMGLAFFMSAMAFSEEWRGDGAGPKLSPGPLASSVVPNCEHSAVAPFLRPGVEVLSEAIPVFFIGRNREGFWVARDTDGRSGGLFWRREAALRFAQRSAAPARCAMVFPQARFELDIENAGDPLVTCIATARRLLVRQVLRLASAFRKAMRT